MEKVFERISKRLLLLVALASATAALAATDARSAGAGQYHVYSCRTPNGESAPADGWSGSKSGNYSYTLNTCSQANGALVAALGDQPIRTANTDVATWAFGAPTGATIEAAAVWRAADADGGGAIYATYESWLAGPEDQNDSANVFGLCINGFGCPVGSTSQPMAPQNRLQVPAVNLGTHLYMHASCVGKAEYECPVAVGDSNSYSAAMYLYAADITLEQTSGPSASGVGGELASAPVMQGDSDVTFSASDGGSGVFEAVFSVDGQAVQSTVVNEDGGRCRDVGQTTDGKPAFLYVQPCLGSVSADVAFDSTKVTNGSHHLIVSVIDAAGNSAPVLDRQITVDNPAAPGAPNGVNASAAATLAVRWQRTLKQALTSRFGRAQRIVGRLTAPGGAPIAGAQIDLSSAEASAGSEPVAMAALHTDADGRFGMLVPPGSPSRTLRFAYRSHLGDARAVATRSLTIRVHAGIVLIVAPRTSSVGRSIFFHGRLRGRPIPRGGKQLVLEARSPGSRWIEFDVIRTDAHGRYRASYRFKFAGPADYRFRVRSEAESDYPFADGSSNVVAVHER